ncbi:MAG: hypothetical protein WB630_05700 [Candidatus Acidiferrales bacterium]
MDRQLAWAAGHPTAEDEMLSYASDTAAYHGKNDKARELSGRAIDLATGDGRKETAAQWQMDLALRESELGNGSESHRQASAARGLSY